SAAVRRDRQIGTRWEGRRQGSSSRRSGEASVHAPVRVEGVAGERGQGCLSHKARGEQVEEGTGVNRLPMQTVLSICHLRAERSILSAPFSAGERPCRTFP